MQWWRLQDSNFNGTGLHQGDLLEKFKENNLAKVNCLVTNTGKTFSNVFISLQLTKSDAKSLSIKVTLKKVSKNNVHISTIVITPIKVLGNKVDFSTIEITSKKERGNHVDFSTSETTSKKVRGNTWNFRPSKLH